MTTEPEIHRQTRDGFDLVMEWRTEGWICSIYNPGSHFAIRTKWLANETAAADWFEEVVEHIECMREQR